MTLRTFLGVAVCCFAAVTFSSSPLRANTIHVSPGDQLGTALAGAAAGDTVLVQCGTYTEQGLQMVDGVTLRSATGDPDCVTIATAGGDPILSCESLYTVTRIEGITFTAIDGGMTTHVARGAALMIVTASPQVTNCVFSDLEAGYGGAVYCGDGASPFFSGCSFTNNQALAVGGALNSIGTSAPVMVNCLFTGNVGVGGGNVLNAATGSRPRFVMSTLADNLAGNWGSALMAWDAGAITMDNCIVSGAAWTGDYSAAPTIGCSDLYVENGIAWSGLLADQEGQAGNISADPQFCGTAGGDVPYSLNENSPCTAAATSGCGRMGAFEIGCPLSGVDDGDDLRNQNIPLATRLRGNYPNPFNPSTTIRYDLKQSGAVEISIFDLAGRRVRQLVNTHLAAGDHEVRWNGTDADDRSVAAGVYFIRLKTADTQDTNRLSLIK